MLLIAVCLPFLALTVQTFRLTFNGVDTQTECAPVDFARWRDQWYSSANAPDNLSSLVFPFDTKNELCAGAFDHLKSPKHYGIGLYFLHSSGFPAQTQALYIYEVQPRFFRRSSQEAQDADVNAYMVQVLLEDRDTVEYEWKEEFPLTPLPNRCFFFAPYSNQRTTITKTWGRDALAEILFLDFVRPCDDFNRRLMNRIELNQIADPWCLHVVDGKGKAPSHILTFDGMTYKLSRGYGFNSARDYGTRWYTTIDDRSYRLEPVRLDMEKHYLEVTKHQLSSSQVKLVAGEGRLTVIPYKNRRRKTMLSAPRCTNSSECGTSRLQVARGPSQKSTKINPPSARESP